MNQSTMEAYAEIDAILNYMDESYINQIPSKIRNAFKELKSKTYIKEIDPSIPLENQNLKRETITLLSVLNYNYWCTDENRKKELMNIYTTNTQKAEEELKEKYNPDNVFNNVKSSDTQSNRGNTSSNNSTNESVDIIVTKESFISKIINKLKGFFKRK